MGVCKPSGRQIPALVMVRSHFLQFQPVKVYGYKLFPYGAVVPRTGLAKLKAKNLVTGKAVYFPQNLYPLPLRNIQIGFPAGREGLVRGGVYQIQGKTNVRVLGRMDVHPEGNAVPPAPVLRLREFQCHAGPAALLSAKTAPGRAFKSNMLPVHQRHCLP